VQGEKCSPSLDSGLSSRVYSWGMAHAVHIGEAAKLTGVSVDTIRFYQKLGLLEAPARSDGGYRLFDGDRFTISDSCGTPRNWDSRSVKSKSCLRCGRNLMPARTRNQCLRRNWRLCVKRSKALPGWKPNFAVLSKAVIASYALNEESSTKTVAHC
jgi:MerR family regulatory protein